eukprot:364880-Chlamydomonas_euryale.AAC.4
MRAIPHPGGSLYRPTCAPSRIWAAACIGPHARHPASGRQLVSPHMRAIPHPGGSLYRPTCVPSRIRAAACIGPHLLSHTCATAVPAHTAACSVSRPAPGPHGHPPSAFRPTHAVPLTQQLVA